MKKVILAIFSVLIFSNHAYACDCAPPNLLEKYSSSDFVFLAKISQTDSSEANVKVLKNWKGNFTAPTISNRGKCDKIWFDYDSKYIVFAHKDSEGKVFIGPCKFPYQVGKTGTDKIIEWLNFGSNI